MGKFNELLKLIEKESSFQTATDKIQEFVDNIENADLVELVENMGVIPESIEPSSSDEKLFSKASDIVVSRAFQDLNFKAKAISERGNAADVIVESITNSYTFVSDAKSFRLSRTAKNQKDFKVDALSKWRGTSDYAVLIAPYFQYPIKSSQIFEQSLLENVLLFSWEHLAILLRRKVEESSANTLEQIWNFPMKYKKRIQASDLQKNYLQDFNQYFIKQIDVSNDDINLLMQGYVKHIKSRASIEQKYLKSLKKEIEGYTKKKAVEELLEARKIPQRQSAIEQFVGSVDNANNKYFKSSN